MEKEKKKSITGTGRLADRLSTFLFYASIILFLTAFNFRDNPGGWQLQYLPNLNGNQINDVTFLDSLTGFFVTSSNSGLGYIYKTTDGGNNWTVKKTNTYPFQRIIFCNSSTGYCSSWDTLFKSTNGGNNWFPVPSSAGIWITDMHVLNADTIWAVDNNGLEGGVFRSTNGGQNWIQQFAQFNQNPDKIYMVNRNLGFIGRDQSYTGRTTNGGFNWTLTSPDTSFYDIKFADSLTGWRTGGANIKKTTDGGVTWQWQKIPQLNFYNIILQFSIVNKDTIFSVGGVYQYPSSYRGLIYKTTNGGTNWGYQIPDTSFGITRYWKLDFANYLYGWAFCPPNNKDINTNTGGDSTLYTSIKNEDSQLADNFNLFQNYPNPFNQSTIIKYEIKKSGYVTLKVYDITGKEIRILTDGIKPSGNYEIRFDAGGLASGIYLYKLSVISQGKEQSAINKMILVK